MIVSIQVFHTYSFHTLFFLKPSTSFLLFTFLLEQDYISKENEEKSPNKTPYLKTVALDKASKMGNSLFLTRSCLALRRSTLNFPLFILVLHLSSICNSSYQLPYHIIF